MMSKKITRLMQLLFEPKLLVKVLSMKDVGYLSEIGWINSFINKMPMDKSSKPLPWVTYGFIDFISSRLDKNMDIFEYGSGNSTLWYSQKVNSVSSVEHDKQWFERAKSAMPNNVELKYKKLASNGEYSNASIEQSRNFDLVIVDGRDRVNCIKKAINCIKDNGVIVLDDSERERYIEGVEFLLNMGFKKIDFWGISPGLFYKKNTTIFYKSNNCLGI